MVATLPEGEASQDRFVFAVVRGDTELNETKLTNALKAKELRPATEDEIRAVGAVPGYASPVGLMNTLVVVDDLVPQSPNLVSGANEDGYHLLNVNYGRDYQADLVVDLSAATDGDACIKCGNPLRSIRGVEVGNIFKLGTRYSDSMGCYFLDKDGKEQPVIMGSFGIGSGRLLGCVAEEHHDENGLAWPISTAPYQVHLVTLSGKSGSKVEQAADEIYIELGNAGIEVLYDDREESPGVKFNDADLIGLPIRLTVSERSLGKKGFELKLRTSSKKDLVPAENVVNRVKDEIAVMEAELAAKVVEVPFEE
jgi:prolyl-tRNA synthetase